jgi:hypothetical protein
VRVRTAFVVLIAFITVCTVGASAQAEPATPNISGAPASILVGYGTFTPSSVDIYYQHARDLPDSGMVTWTFGNSSSAGDMSATDSTGLSLYNSGPHHSPYSFSFTWKWAGTYSYHSTTIGTNGVVKVHMLRSPGSGALGTTFVLKWASAVRTNCVFDVEVKKPGATKWSYLTFGTTHLSQGYRPTVKGFYAIRTRLRNTTSHKFSGFSPAVLIDVT